MKVLIIGGAGYIGSHTVLEFIDRGFNVTVFDNLSSGHKSNIPTGTTLVIGDLQNQAQLIEVLKQNYDLVVHFAALKAAGESMLKPEDYAQQNICGTMNLLTAMAKTNTKNIIFSSTAAVYGAPKYLPIDEQHPVNPINYYGFTKYQIEENLHWFDQLHGIKFVSLRYFNACGYDARCRVGGLEQNPANLIPIVMEAATGQRDYLQIFGDDYQTRDGTGERDYIHVSDLARAHVDSATYLADGNPSLKVNLGTGQAISVLDIIKATEHHTKTSLTTRIIDRRPGDPDCLYADSSLAKERLGWFARESTLEHIIATSWAVYKHLLKPL